MLPPLKKKNKMGQCGNCLENNWTFEFNDGLVTATCKWCEHQVQFEGGVRKNRAKKAYLNRQAARVTESVNLHHRFIAPGAGPERPAHILPWD